MSIIENIYSASKSFSRVLGESLWIDLVNANVTVMNFIPGLTATPTLEKVLKNEQRHSFLESDPFTSVEEGFFCLKHNTTPNCYVGTIPKILSFIGQLIPAPLRLKGTKLSTGIYKEELTNNKQ